MQCAAVGTAYAAIAGGYNEMRGNAMSRVTHFHDWITSYHLHFSSPLPGLLVIIGSAGSGKTTLLNEWLASLTTLDPYPILPAQRRFTPADIPSPSLLAHRFVARQRETPAQVARRLSEDLGFHPSARSATDLWREATDFLQEASLNLLIIDQAERFSLAVCQCVRDYLFDQHICSLLLVGALPLITRLHSDPALASRVFDWRTITDFDHHLDALASIGPESEHAPKTL
jgi:hypothetical protein